MGATCSNIKNQNVFNIMELPYNIHVMAYIWSDNGHNLFDYESDSLVKKSIDFDFQGRVVQLDRDILALTKNEVVRNQREIFEFRSNQKYIEIYNPKIENAFWKVIRPIQASDLPTLERQKLIINTTIKLGRVKLTVLDYSFAYEFDDGGGVPDELDEKNNLNDSEFVEGQVQCRFCLSKLAKFENPFISPCKCAGSIKYIHLKCLQSWINSQLKTKTQNGVTLYYWKSMKCELCKTMYKTSFKFKTIQYNICDINKPKEPYLLLQINHSDKNKEQGLYVIDIKTRDTIKIGRTQDCDIKLHDISVSRHHASILVNHQEQSFFLEDNCSKFGTLVLAQDEDLQIQLNSPKRLALQVGRIVIVVTIEKKINKKKINKYRVPAQFEVFRQIKQHEDEVEQQSAEQQQQSDVEDILINDPTFDRDQDMSKFKNMNFLTGSIIQREQQ
ncbi:unnamed protein product (macronuclear) [Paramecium tetraurelia]|uniref:FHA domain-containing protein n=1 Tax=Paramecium tetraurelia TaxID=5888 RepID=A0EC89_PARTE|nr:uncharacterized protein GSPATT00025642001 [Paramecium tetraurelia]CAK92906.1 unnamed protein product [Paramecium tetraurelia]|eukprot:XP_001460303.1 hypothetical protein (macronuclear) [Paramecium tetraurelia strain d4-2]